MVAVAFLLIISTWISLSQGQLMHAKRLLADYGKLQSIYAAEAGIYARLEASSDLQDVPLAAGPDAPMHYTAWERTHPDGTWIESTGSAVVGGFEYQSTARAQVELGRIMFWDLGGG